MYRNLFRLQFGLTVEHIPVADCTVNGKLKNVIGNVVLSVHRVL
jgi:hypothetical protein